MSLSYLENFSAQESSLLHSISGFPEAGILSSRLPLHAEYIP